jgi:hypothetical protein
MDIKSLIRDKDYVLSSIQKLDDFSLIAKRPVKIYIPASFADRGLAEISVDTYIVGIYAMVVEDKYLSTSMVNAMMKIKPRSTMKVKFHGEEYYEFGFDTGDIITPTTKLVKKDTLVYNIYNEFISKGRIPWYITYDILGELFSTAKKHANANVGENPELTELIISIIARDRRDRTKYYRTSIQQRSDLKNYTPAYIPLKSVQYAATNTTAKLAGSYFGQGVGSALLSPAERSERIETLLRT